MVRRSGDAGLRQAPRWHLIKLGPASPNCQRHVLVSKKPRKLARLRFSVAQGASAVRVKKASLFRQRAGSSRDFPLWLSRFGRIDRAFESQMVVASFACVPNPGARPPNQARKSGSGRARFEQLETRNLLSVTVDPTGFLQSQNLSHQRQQSLHVSAPQFVRYRQVGGRSVITVTSSDPTLLRGKSSRGARRSI